MQTPEVVNNTITKDTGIKLQTPRRMRSFHGWYLHGNSHPLFKLFEFPGTLPEAIARFKDHCSRMGYKFVRVRPHIVDLTEQENLKLNNSEWTEDQDIPQDKVI